MTEEPRASRGRRPRRPSRWIIGLGVLFLLLGAGSIGYLVFYMAPSSRSAAMDDWETRLLATASDRQVAINRWIRDVRSDAETLGRYPTAVYILSGDSGPPYPFGPEGDPVTHLEELLGELASVHDFLGAAIHDATGAALARSGAQPEGGDFTRLVQEALTANSPRVDLLNGDSPRIGVATPIAGQGGHVIGVALVEVDPRPFLYWLLTEQPVPSRTGETVLVTRDGSEIVYVSPLRKATYRPGGLRLGAGASELAAAAATSGVTGLGRYVDYQGDAVLAATQPVAGTPWALVAKADMDEVLAEYRTELLRVAAAIAGLLVGVFGLGFGFWRWQHQRLASAVLRERARFAAVLDNANDPIFFFSAEGRILDLNQRAEEFYGYSRHRLMGKPAGVLRADAGGATDPDHLAAARERGTVMVETRHRLADGTTVPVEISTRRVEIEGDEILISIVRDIRERKTAEDALRKTEERYRTLVENLPDLIARFGPDLRCQFVSPAPDHGSPFGVDPVGRTYRELGLPPEAGEALHAALGEVFETDAARELEVVVPDGDQERAFDWRIIPERDRSGVVTSALNIVRESTEQRALAHQLQQSQKMEAIGRLAGGVAHDFNNILTSIQGHAALVLEEMPPADARRADLEEIARSAERASALTTQLLAFSRRQIVRSKVVDVGEVVRGMENMLRRLIGEHIALEVDVGDAQTTIKADPSQVEQVVLNLAVNARDAMPDGGRITIHVDQAPWEADDGGTVAERAVRLVVADTGVGMDADTVDRIFEPFYTTKEASKGTGLGLSTVYGIVEQSGGKVEVESEPGAGTRLAIYFPAVDPAPAETGGRVAPERRGSGTTRRATVLLVEDEDGVRALAERVLARQGHRVHPAQSGPEALEVARELDGTLDLLLTDMVMPGMDGRELAQRVLALHPECRVLLMSGYTEDAVIRRQELAKNTRFVGKPFTPNELIRHVEATLTAPVDDEAS